MQHDTLIAIKDIPMVLGLASGAAATELSERLVESIESGELKPRGESGLKTDIDELLKSATSRTPSTLAKQYLEAPKTASDPFLNPVRELVSGFSKEGLRKKMAKGIYKFAYLTRSDIRDWLENRGVSWDAKSSDVEVTTSETQDTTHLVRRKRAALVSEVKEIWPRIESDLNNAKRNGLGAHAKFGEHGYWDLNAAIHWAIQEGKITKTRAAKVLVREEESELATILRTTFRI